VQMGQLAQEKGASDGVRSFGQMLQQEHSAGAQKATAVRELRCFSSDQAERPGQPKLHRFLRRQGSESEANGMMRAGVP
jgi:hypothetical protein